jgi:hypothetical protein
VSLFAAVVAASAMCVALSACVLVSDPLAGDPLGGIKINEVESDGLADFIELINTNETPTDVSALVLKDNDDSRRLVIPGGTSIPAGGFLAVDTNVAGGFGLEQSDAARVFRSDGTTLLDSYSWTSHASTTYGRCPDGTGAFLTTNAVTKGAANACPATVPPWPGSASVTMVDQAGVLGSDLSGLDYEGTGTSNRGVLWAVKGDTNALSDCCGMAPNGRVIPPTAGRRARRCTSPAVPACPTPRASR